MFEHSLIDLETAKQPRRRWISLPIAIALHVVGFTAFAFASYWTVGSVAEPNTVVPFVQLVPSPELPADDGSSGRPKIPETRPVQQETKPVKPSQPVQPTAETVPTTIPTPPVTVNADYVLTAEDADDSTGAPTLSSGTGTGDGKGGDGKGSVHGDGNGSEPGVGNGQPIRITVGMTKPEPIHLVQPRYPESLRHTAIQGTMVLEAVIDEQGNVTDVRILKGLPSGLDREAVAAVQQWKFKPALLAGKPVKVYYTLTVNFMIQR